MREGSLKKLYSRLKSRFATVDFSYVYEKQLHLRCGKSDLVSVLYHVKHIEGFVFLQLISSVDWEERGEFQITYLVWNPEQTLQLVVSTRIPREGYEVPSMIPMWPHAETFEREIREMFGIGFAGNPRQDEEFLLEDWVGPPPMLRSFDTLAYSMEMFGERPGRHSIDPRKHISKAVGEWELPWPGETANSSNARGTSSDS